MTDPNAEIEAARRMLEDPAATASPVADPEVRAAMEQMAQTAAALRAWRKNHETMPAPVIAPVARASSNAISLSGDGGASAKLSGGNANDADKQTDANVGLPVGAVGPSRGRIAGHQTSLGEIDTGKSRVSRTWLTIGAAAAAAIIVVGIVVGLRSTRQGGDSGKLAADLAWAGKTAPAAPADQSVRMEFDTQGGGDGHKFGAGAPPGNMEGGGVPAPGVARSGPPGELQPPELDAFIRQFAFSFRIPQQLPGGWEFERGRPISETRVQLIYRFQDQSLSVFVSPAGGGDLEFRNVEIGGRKMSAGRRGGLAIAFEGGQADMKIWNAIARELTAKEDSPQRTQRTQR